MGVLLGLYFLALLGVILDLAYRGNLPSIIQVVPFFDKVGHVVIYGIGSYLGHRLLRRLHWRGLPGLPFWPVLFTSLTIIEEGLQMLSKNRTFSLLDLGASLLGIAIGYWLAEIQAHKL